MLCRNGVRVVVVAIKVDRFRGQVFARSRLGVTTALKWLPAEKDAAVVADAGVIGRIGVEKDNRVLLLLLSPASGLPP